MRELNEFYIDGTWTAPTGTRRFEVVDPATEEPSGSITMGEPADVDAAVAAARRAFPSYSTTSIQERVELLQTIGSEYQKRRADLAEAITLEVGAPRYLAKEAHTALPMHHLDIAIETLRTYPFHCDHGSTRVIQRPIGVCGLITPWNWPVAVIFMKLAPALATGCTAVLKPSEYASFSSHIMAEVFDAAGVPAGVVNIIYGDGATVGTAMAAHPDIDMVSITGSTRAGAQVARIAAPTIKRVHQELGGKSPNIILESADLENAVTRGVQGLMLNSGQSCQAPSRMLVPRSRVAEAEAAAKTAADATSVAHPAEDAVLGPVINANQFARIQSLIQRGLDEGATLVAGGTGRPDGLDKGYYVKPTVLGNVTAEMTIAQEEIFGPVLVMQPYDDLEDAVRIANATRYGLATYIQGGDLDEVKVVAERVPAGQIFLNGSGIDIIDLTAPFGGLKHSGNGREWGAYGFESFLEPVALIGYTPTSP
jgi:aldehyde dehydrogenase (NAD+)